MYDVFLIAWLVALPAALVGGFLYGAVKKEGAMRTALLWFFTVAFIGTLLWFFVFVGYLLLSLL